MQPRTKPILLTLFLLAWAGGASAFVCLEDTVNLESGVSAEFTDLTYNYPSGDMTSGTPIEFQVTASTCHTSEPGFYELILNLSQVDDAVYTNTSTDTSGSLAIWGNTTFNFTLAPTNGVYNMSYRLRFGTANIGSPVTYLQSYSYELPETPYLLTVAGASDVGIDTEGACLTQYGYYFAETAGAAEDYILHDFTDMSHFCVDTNCSNIFSDEVPTYVTGTDYEIMVNTTVYKPYNLYIGGFNYDYNHTQTSATEDKTITYTGINNFTRQNNAYFIDLVDELSGDAFDLESSNKTILAVLCERYSPDFVDLQTINLTNILMTSEEEPLFHLTENEDIDRKYQTYEATENISLYIPEVGDINFVDGTQTWIVDYILESYISGWDNSYLKIGRNTNTSIVTIWQQRWVGLQIEGVDLLNDTYYQYTIYDEDDDEERIIKWDQIRDNDTRTLVIQTPTSTDTPKYIDKVEFYITSDYNNSELGVVYDSGGSGIVNVTVTVYNYTGGQFTVMDTTVATADSGTITVIVPDNNQTYYMIADIYTDDYGKTTIAELVKIAITENRFPFYDAFGLPASVYGVSRDRIYTGAAMFIITGIAFMLSGLEVATGGLLVVAVIGVFTFLGWLREMTWSLWLFLASMAIMWKLVEGRRQE